MGKPLIDRKGLRFERLVVIERAENYRGNAQWRCRCDCGNYITALGNDLQRGKVKSCGCRNREELIKHGMSYSPVYRVWQQMLQRCENPNCKAFRNYGARGISVCSEWHDFNRFLSDMGMRAKGYQIERIDNDKGYSPDNCRWATSRDQMNNTRRNRVLEFSGHKQTIAQWAGELGVGWDMVRSRLRYGWSVERALTEPIRVTKK